MAKSSAELRSYKCSNDAQTSMQSGANNDEQEEENLSTQKQGIKAQEGNSNHKGRTSFRGRYRSIPYMPAVSRKTKIQPDSVTDNFRWE